MKTKVLCKYLGGSHLYKLNGPNSDVDERGVFMHTDPAYVLGTKRMDEERKQNDEVDFVVKELNHFVTLLKKSNSEALECLFAEESAFHVMTPEFCLFRVNATSFIDSEKLFKCLMGYTQGERRLATGERTGQLGGKRKSAVDTYGFSPKNFTQMFRLLKLGTYFFNQNKFVVDVSYFDDKTHNLLRSVKFTPEKHNKEELNELSYEFETELKESFDNRQKDFKFDEDLANKLLLSCYKPYLK